MLLDNYRIAEQVQQYCYLAPGVINVWIRPISNATSGLVQPALDKDQHGMIAENQQPAMDKSGVQGCPEGESQQIGSKARIAAGRCVLESRRHFLWGLLAGGLGMFGITLAGRALHVGSFSSD